MYYGAPFEQEGSPMDPTMQPAFWNSIGVLLVLLIVFLIGRELICWYWKVNERTALLTEIRDLLKAQAAQVPPI